LKYNFVKLRFNQENTVLARSAAEIAKRLPSEAVSPTDYYAIAVALQYAYDLNGAEEFLKYGMSANPDFNTEIAILRVSANLQFIKGHAEAGRVEYQKALNIFSKYPDYDPYTKASTNIQTELFWSFAEAGVNSIEEARQHIDQAARLVSSLPRSPGSDGIRLQLEQARGVITNASIGRPGVPNLLSPTPTTLPNR
jgi:tetratricopeptide (TPR) repeat protein